MTPRRALITLDAVGGVWRYALDLARAQARAGTESLLVGLGPEPSAAQQAEAAEIPGAELTWTAQPLDWLAENERQLQAVGPTLARLAGSWRAEMLHLNAPGQAADIDTQRPVTVASHSCTATWWEAVRGTPLPAEWDWMKQLNRRGFARAHAIVTPSAAHGSALLRVYGSSLTAKLCIVHNATEAAATSADKQPTILAAGRWWDEAKGGATLDAAAAQCHWPVQMAGALKGPNGQALVLRHATALGQLSALEMAAAMADAAIFVAPARYEPFGLAVLEAASSGAALVLSDIPTFRELWEGAAIFVAPGKPRPLAEALNRLAGDPAERQRLAQAASARAARFSVRAQTAATHAAYDRALRHSAASLLTVGG